MHDYFELLHHLLMTSLVTFTQFERFRRLGQRNMEQARAMPMVKPLRETSFPSLTVVAAYNPH
jgi:hypothetical protein